MNRAYYNEFNPFAAQWLRNLIDAKLIADGDVDDRSIKDVKPTDLVGYTQCHFFAGIGGWSLALRLAGWPDDRPVWTGSCPCFPKGTLVITNKGQKPIEDIKVGDEVLTHKGRYKPVVRVGMNKNQPIVKVKGQGHWGMLCTPNHPFMVKSGEFKRADELDHERWVNIGNVPYEPIPDFKRPKGYVYDRGKYKVSGSLNNTVYIGRFNSLEEAVAARKAAIDAGKIAVRGADDVDVTSTGFAYFLGRWIGDGWTSGDGVFICDSFDDEQAIKDTFTNAKMGGCVQTGNTGVRVTIGSKELSRYLNSHFGKGALNKRIPNWVLSANEEYRRSFLSGWMDSDGNSAQNYYQITTVSRQLVVGLKMLLIGLGYSPTIRFSEPYSAFIDGRKVNVNGWYTVRFTDAPRSFSIENGIGYGLVRSVEQVGESDVYNLEVEDDHTYTADGIVVHNCQPFSVAGTRKGTEDDRHLWPYWYELIRQCKPPVIFGEQVENAVKWGWLDLVQTDLEREDYATAAAVLPACSIGAPHLRKRLWFVGYTNGERLERHARDGDSSQGWSEQDRPATTASGDVSMDDAKSNGLEDGIPWVERQPVRDITGASNGVSVEDTAGIGWGGRCERVPQGNGQPVQATGCGNVDSMADTEHDGRDGNEVRRSVSQSEAESGMLKPQGRSTDKLRDICRELWSDTRWYYCRDDKWRPVKRGTSVLVNGLSKGMAKGRAEILKGFGNAIVPQVGAAFIKAAMECIP